MTTTKQARTGSPFARVLESAPLDPESIRKWLGLTQEELGQVVGRDRRSVARWEATVSSGARGGAALVLRKVARLRLLLEDLTDQETARSWIRTPNREFRAQSPLDLLVSGRIDEVLAALEVLADGGPY